MEQTLQLTVFFRYTLDKCKEKNSEPKRILYLFSRRDAPSSPWYSYKLDWEKQFANPIM